MDINKILQHPAINRAEIARRLYPGLTTNRAKSKLTQKIVGHQGRRISEEEQNRIFQIWTNIKEEIHKPMIQERVNLIQDSDGKITSVKDPNGRYIAGVDPY